MTAPARRASLVGLALTMLVSACSSSGGSTTPGGTGGAGAGGAPAGSGGQMMMPGQGGDPGGGPIGGAAMAPAATCGDVAAGAGALVQTKLPKLPELANVRACVNVDAVNVTFDPLDPAVDYRIYPLPADGDVVMNADGSFVVKDAIYRCAGTREALYMLMDQPTVNDNAAGGSTILNGMVRGFTRAEADAQLGHVYTRPDEGRLPVHVLGSGDPKADGGFACGRPVFNSTRPKTYTTDARKRAELIAAHARDEGIAFYVPAAPGAGTRVVYEGSIGNDGDVLRWIDGPEGSMRQGKGAPLFNVLAAAGADTAPLMRVFVAPYCNRAHDELVAGMARFRKVRAEGDHPLTALRWSGLTRPGVLVIEALDGGCPYQGHLSPVHADALVEKNGTFTTTYEAYLTLADMRAASPTKEIFVNGQYDTTTVPRAIARSYVQVTPQAPPAMDFFTTFPESEQLEAFHDVPGEQWVNKHMQSPTFDFSTFANSRYYFGTMLGELWFVFNDVAADTPGKVRLTPLKKAALSADSFLHVTTEMDFLSTFRRYPQILISDQGVPVQNNLKAGITLVVQPKDFTPSHLQAQICDHRNWDVNDQCPRVPLFGKDFAPAVQAPGEMVGTDNTMKLDIFVSSRRLYLLVDDKPYACTELPAKGEDGNVYHPPTGPVTVTWGDVLYHSGVDFEGGGGPIKGHSYEFHRKHMHVATRRHFDNLGFASGRPAPVWDEVLFPCAKSM